MSRRRPRPRPSERSAANGAAKDAGRSADHAGKRPPPPSAAAMRAARARMTPPPAPWHPVPLAEGLIVLGMVAMVGAMLLRSSQGLVAGFLAIIVGTAEFSWREHRHGFRSHGALLGAIIGLVCGVLLWRVVGLPSRTSLIVAGVIFAGAWGVLTSTYRSMAERESEGSAS